MNFYPYANPTTLTDAIFSVYGGDATLGTDQQRKVAYWMAEQVASNDIGTFLLPTIVTGTYLFANRIMLDYAYVSEIQSVKFIDIEENVYWEVSGTSNVYVHLIDEVYSIVDIDGLLGYCNCYSNYGNPYKVQIAYKTGLPTGIAHNPDVLLALSTYASIILNEIVGYGNESPGDIGVQSWANQDYRENRVTLLRTSFGTSARAQFASKLLTRLRKFRYVSL